MTDDEVLIEMRLALADLAQSSPARAGLQRAVAEMHQRLQRASVLYFWRHPGYAQIGTGEPGPPIPEPPELPGLEHAWRIFLAGPAAGHLLTAVDLVGPQARPDNALRNELGKAARWVEQVARCPALAAEMRSPSIVVRADGSLAYTPRRTIMQR